MVGNLCKAWKKWEYIFRILVKEGEYAQTSGTIFKAVVRAVILFESETWVLTPHMGRPLGVFNNSMAHRLTGKPPRWLPDDGW